MSKYHGFVERLDALFEAGRTKYLGLYAILTDALEAVNAAKTPAESYKAKVALENAGKDWADKGGERIALSFEWDSNRLEEQLQQFILEDNERFKLRDYDQEAAVVCQYSTDPEVFRRMIERFKDNQVMLHRIAHRLDHAVDYICARDLPDEKRNALKKLRQEIRLEDEGKERAFSHLVQAYQEAAGCELSVNALQNGKATWELDTATRKAAAEF